MTAYCSLPELKAYLGNFASNDPLEPEFSDTSLQQKLDSHAVKIKSSWNKRFRNISIPSPVGAVATPSWLDLILEKLNLDLTVAEILAIQAIRKFRLGQKQSAIYKAFGFYVWKLFESGHFDPALIATLKENKVFDTTSFLDSDELALAGEAPGLTITNYTKPNLDQTERFCLRESAFLRAIAWNNRFETTVASLSSDQLEIYTTALTSLVAPQVARINLSYDPDAVATEVASSLLDNNPSSIYAGKRQIEALLDGSDYYSIFFPQ